MQTDRQKLLSHYSEDTLPALLMNEEVFNADNCIHKEYLSIFDEHGGFGIPIASTLKKMCKTGNSNLKMMKKPF